MHLVKDNFEKHDITECLDIELSLIVYKDFALYKRRNRIDFIDGIKQLFICTDAQLNNLINDLKEENK